MSEIAISSDGRDSIAGFRRKVAAGEANGAASIWVASHLFERDPVSLTSLALAETTRMGAALVGSSFGRGFVDALLSDQVRDELKFVERALSRNAGKPVTSVAHCFCGF